MARYVNVAGTRAKVLGPVGNVSKSRMAQLVRNTKGAENFARSGGERGATDPGYSPTNP